MEHYGSADAVKGLLGNDGEGAETWTDERESRIVALLGVVSRLLEHETACRFGSSTAETVEIETEDGDDTLFLDKGLRSVTSIVESPTTWSGTAWTGGTTLATTDYRLSGKVTRHIDHDTDSTVYRILRRVGGGWSGRYIITGVWEDRVPTVPQQIDYLANYISAETFKKQKASPAGFVGPDGAVVPIREVMREPDVKRLLDAWRVGPALLVL